MNIETSCSYSPIRSKCFSMDMYILHTYLCHAIQLISFFCREYHEFENVPMANSWIKYNSPDVEKLYGLYRNGKSIWMESAFYDTLFFQNSGIKSRIMENFRLKDTFIDLAKRTMEKLGLKKKHVPVGVHVRKGDLVKLERVKNMSPVTPDFYLNAMKKLRKKFGSKVVFLLITDNIQWCQENLLSKRKNIKLVTDPSRPEIESIGHDLAIMSLCDYSIISRGTFSLWVKHFSKGGAIAPNLPSYYGMFERMSE